MGSSSADNHNSFPPRVQPGDTIEVHAGLYKDNRLRYAVGGLGTLSDGTYFLTRSGTPDRPIVIKAAGDGVDTLFDVTAASNIYFEGLTIRNTGLAILAGRKDIIGSSGLTVKHSSFEKCRLRSAHGLVRFEGVLHCRQCLHRQEQSEHSHGLDGKDLARFAGISGSAPFRVRHKNLRLRPHRCAQLIGMQRPFVTNDLIEVAGFKG
jgi:hypothetical protein